MVAAEGCGSRAGSAATPAADGLPESKSLTSAELKYAGEEEEPMIGAALQMYRIGDALVIYDSKADSVFHLINLAERRYLGQFGRKGGGPGEFDNITILSPVCGSMAPVLGIYEPMKGLYSEAAIDLSSATRPVSYRPVMTTDTAGWYMNRMASGNYVCSNGYVDHYELFTIYSPEGRTLGHYGDRMLTAAAEAQPPIAATAAFQYDVKVSPDGSHVVAIGQGERAGFYRVAGDSLELVSQFAREEADPEYVFGDGIFLGQKPGDKPIGFVTAAVNDSGVFVLVSDKSMNDDDKADGELLSFTGDIIRVYDWEGNQRSELKLDRRVRQITAPAGDGRIYAITEQGCDPTVIYFDL